MLAIGAAIGARAATTAEANWPQWRGPLQNGVAPSASPPTSWSETSNVKWKVKIPGEGSATPIIWGDRVFVQTAIATGKKVEAPAEPAAQPPPGPPPGQGGPPPGGPGGKKGPGGRGGFPGGAKPTETFQFVVQCLDRQTGKTLWQQVAREEVPHEGHHPSDGTFASPSGLTDGQHYFAHFGSHGLYCFDFEGKLEWQQDLGKMRIAMSFGEGSSPAIYQDTLIVNWDNEDGSFICALDKRSGKTLWKKSREERTSWATPLVVDQGGKAQVITAATGKVRSYAVATGELVWECAGLTRNVIPSPIADGGMLYCTSGYQGSSLLAIRLDRTGDLSGSDAIAWSYKKNTPYVPSPLLYENRLYFFAVNKGELSGLDPKTGEVFLDAVPIPDLSGVYASPVGAGGRIYLVGRNGVTVVVKPSAKLEVLASNRLNERFDASPAAAGKQLFLRGKELLYCLEQNP